MTIRFSKMHGIGNDFVIVDRRRQAIALDPALLRAMADRHTGIGYDQLLTIDPAQAHDCLAAYRIYNADGSPAGQCGNGVRCVAAWLHRDGGGQPDRFSLEGPSGTVECMCLSDGRVRAQMGIPRFAPSEVPFEATADAAEHELQAGELRWRIGVVSMGNPHAVLEVADAHRAPVARWGPLIECHPRFPERTNVGFAQVIDAHRVRLRVHERGVGETWACGSGACAAAATLIRRGRLRSPVDVELPGGTLAIEWPAADQPLWMTGNAAFVFEGTWP